MRPTRPYRSLYEWRRQKGLQGQQAAQRLGISPGYYSRLERQVMFPTRLLGKTIADITGVPLETVLGV